MVMNARSVDCERPGSTRRKPALTCWRLPALLPAHSTLAAATSMAVLRRKRTGRRSYPSILGFGFDESAAMILGGWLVDRLGPRWSLTPVGTGTALFTALTGGSV